MPEAYSITVRNMSGADQNYFLFKEPPTESGKPQENVYTNVYQTAHEIPTGEGNFAEFTFEETYYAIYGSMPGTEIGTGARVKTGGSNEVEHLTQKDEAGKLVYGGDVYFLTTKEGKYPRWKPDAVAVTSTAEGAFEIRADNTFQYPNHENIFIGVGQKDPHNSKSIIPVCTIPAQPTTNKKFFPKPKYYISTGEYIAGEIVDITSVGDPFVVDFLKLGKHDVVLVHKNNGELVFGK